MRLGLIGCGRIAQLGYVPALARCGAIDLVAVADPSDARRSSLAEQTGARPFASAAELIATADLDGVVVASPPAEHLPQARLAADAGLACLVEKPPAEGALAAAELATLDPMPWIGFNRRFHHGRELHEVASRHQPLELELELRYRRRSWRAHEVADCVLLDLAPHLIDLALLLGGEPQGVRETSCGPRRAELTLATARGTARIRCASDRPYFERVVVRSRDGQQLGSSASGGVIRALSGRLRRAPHPLVDSLTRELEAFACVAAGGDGGLLATAKQGAVVMTVVDEARRAAEIARVSAHPAEATS